MKDRKSHILIIDDDKDITELISDYLVKNNFRTTIAPNGMNIKTLLRENNFDLVVLDIMLPGIDGLTICKMIRETHNLPIIMLSAANSTSDRVVGLELGADDYVSKPFSGRELLARIKAQLRRDQGELHSDKRLLKPLSQIHFDNWKLDRDTHSLIDKEGVVIPLSQREYDLLLVFLENPERILSRNQLMDLLYDQDWDPQDRTIDVLIGRLRKKLEEDSRHPKILITVRGGGYRLRTKVSVS